MNCYLCGSSLFKTIFDYKTPDKYEKWMGIQSVNRVWASCKRCEFIQSFRDYPLEQVEKIYKDGYRNPRFRGETIEAAFKKIISLPDDKSENRQRCDWLIDRTVPGSILDIGSGFGVFPVLISQAGYSVECVEENGTSIEFIKSLGFECYDNIPDKSYDIVSLIHVLEHIEDPISFLKRVRENSKKWLFIEVPDAVEFGYLDSEHDEFNSCHTKFYDREHLMDVVEKSGYYITDMTSKYYQERKLSRILALCE